MLKSFKLLFVSLFFSGGLFSQEPTNFSELKSTYPGFNYIQTLRKTNVKIDVVKNKPQIKTNYTDEYLVMNNQGSQMLTDDYIEFTTLESVAKIEAYTLIPAVKGYKKVPATDFKTVDVEQSGSVFHDGSKKTTMLFQGLTEGAYRHLSYENSSSEYHIPFGAYFASHVPIVSAVFEIDHDTSIHLIYKAFNTENNDIKFEEKIVKNRRIWTWTKTNSKAVKLEDRAPSSAYFLPSIYAQISHLHTKNGTQKVLGTTVDLFNWYQASISAVLNEPISSELSQIAQELTKDKKDEFDKVKAVYYWVQNNIKYIAFEEGVNGYIPRKPSLVFEKRYGDCKDMATLIYSMLREVNVKVNLAWIGSRDLPFKYTEFPSSIVDNHMIAIYASNNKHYVLDATSSFQPIEYPTSFIQNKEALLYKGENEFEIITIRTPENRETTMIDTSYIQVDNRKIIGSSAIALKGYYNIFLNERFKDVPKDKIKETLQGIMLKGNNSFKVIEGSVVNVSEREKDLYINFDFEVENYVTSFEKEMYLNLILEKNIVSITEIKEDRTIPVEFDNLTHDQYTVAFEIPKDLQLKTMPKNVEYLSDIVDFNVKYNQVGKTVFMTLQLDVKTLLLLEKDFKKWNEFTKMMKKACSETLVLNKL